MSYWGGWQPWPTRADARAAIMDENPLHPDRPPKVAEPSEPRLAGWHARMQWRDRMDWPERLTFAELEPWLAGWDAAHRRCVIAALGLADVGDRPLRKGAAEHFMVGPLPD